ncbi:MAG: ribonuclease H-like domain-containing protein [Chloroflexota bacterium]
MTGPTNAAGAECYLDIETTGLSPGTCSVTVVGLYTCQGEDTKVTQLVGRDITGASLMEALEGVSTLYTYNGSRFDLPFLVGCLGVDLDRMFPHRDLMYDCWRRRLFGGLKSVERQLGIPRRLADMNGFEAVRLWWRYVDSFDLDALNRLLEYNKEDVVNLQVLKEKLL